MLKAMGSFAAFAILFWVAFSIMGNCSDQRRIMVFVRKAGFFSIRRCQSFGIFGTR